MSKVDSVFNFTLEKKHQLIYQDCTEGPDILSYTAPAGQAQIREQKLLIKQQNKSSGSIYRKINSLKQTKREILK